MVFNHSKESILEACGCEKTPQRGLMQLMEMFGIDPETGNPGAMPEKSSIVVERLYKLMVSGEIEPEAVLIIYKLLEEDVLSKLKDFYKHLEKESKSREKKGKISKFFRSV
jgi:hypothetical protein